MEILVDAFDNKKNINLIYCRAIHTSEVPDGSCACIQ